MIIKCPSCGAQHSLERRGEPGIVHPRLGVIDRRIHPRVHQQVTIGQSGERRRRLVVGGGGQPTDQPHPGAGRGNAGVAVDQLVLGHPRPRRFQGGGVSVGAVAEGLGAAALAGTTLLGRRRGDLLTRVVADIDAVLDVVVRVAVPFAAGGVVVLGTTVLIGVYEPLTAAALLATSLLAAVGAPWLANRLSRDADAAIAPARAGSDPGLPSADAPSWMALYMSRPW